MRRPAVCSPRIERSARNDRLRACASASSAGRPSSCGSRRRRSYPARRREPEPDSPVRTPFQRDRDRIVHSKAFRRLKHKTQVFIAPEGDHYRTRLTHTLETCGIARTVARALGLNEDLTEAIGLGHDLGHPPFGHIGEEALDAGAARARRRRLPAQRALAARRRRARARRPRAQPDRAGPRRDPQPHRADASRRRSRGGSCGWSTGSPTSTTTSTTPCGPGSSPRTTCRPREIELLGPTGAARIDTLVRDIVERSRERRRHRPERGDRRRDAAAAQVHVRRASISGPRRAASTSGCSGRCAACSTTTSSTPTRCRSGDPAPTSCQRVDRLRRRDDRPLLHRHASRELALPEESRL